MEDDAHQQVSSDQDTAGPRSELSHDNIPFLLVHVTMLQRSNKKLLLVPMLITSNAPNQNILLRTKTCMKPSVPTCCGNEAGRDRKETFYFKQGER